MAACRKFAPAARSYAAARLMAGTGLRVNEASHAWVATTMNYIHVRAAHAEDAWIAGQKRAADRLKGLGREVEPAAGRR